MQRSSATVVALVGSEAGAVVPSLGQAGRVRAVEVDPDLPALERATVAQQRVGGSGSTLAVHDADPLADVVQAWTRLYDGTGAAGELEIAVAAAVARWRARSVELPDYYLVLDPDGMAPTRRHWYLGVLTGAAPTRVVPLAGRDAVPTTLRRLPVGRWWPPLDRLLDGVDRQVPDRLVPAADEPPSLLTPGA